MQATKNELQQFHLEVQTCVKAKDLLAFKTDVSQTALPPPPPLTSPQVQSIDDRHNELARRAEANENEVGRRLNSQDERLQSLTRDVKAKADKDSLEKFRQV